MLIFKYSDKLQGIPRLLITIRDIGNSFNFFSYARAHKQPFILLADPLLYPFHRCLKIFSIILMLLPLSDLLNDNHLIYIVTDSDILKFIQNRIPQYTVIFKFLVQLLEFLYTLVPQFEDQYPIIRVHWYSKFPDRTLKLMGGMRLSVQQLCNNVVLELFFQLLDGVLTEHLLPERRHRILNSYIVHISKPTF